MAAKNYSIICRPVDAKLASQATQEAYRTAKKYFKTLPKFKVELLYSRKRIDKEQGYKTQSWLCGFTRKNTIMIVAPSVWTKITPHPLNNFKKVLCHELVHIVEHAKLKQIPAQWLAEGLALYIAGQRLGPIKIKNLQKILNLNHNKIWTNAVNKGYPAYPYAAKIAEYLIKKYGFKKYLELSKKTSRDQNKKDAEKTIKKVYNHTAKEIFNEIQKTSGKTN